LQGEWTLDDAQQSALLDVVADAPGLRVLGTTEDRVGREVVGLAGIPSASENTDVTLLLSTATGRIVGFESALIAANTELDLPAGSLTEYACGTCRIARTLPGEPRGRVSPPGTRGAFLPVDRGVDRQCVELGALDRP
ncbi:hypothetical protein HR12_35265, partial [Microbacterium sp. SUBG005]